MRLKREARTIEAMILLYCRGHRHGGEIPCGSCSELRDYAFQRVDKCKFGADKPVCAKCPVHCYRPEMRERVREFMRWSGPRMIWRHPLLAILHLRDSSRSRAGSGA